MDKKNRECLKAIKPILEKVRPRISTFELVLGILDPKRAKYFNFIKESFISLGYKIKDTTIHCVDHGLPQKRDRFLMIAYR